MFNNKFYTAWLATLKKKLANFQCNLSLNNYQNFKVSTCLLLRILKKTKAMEFPIPFSRVSAIHAAQNRSLPCQYAEFVVIMRETEIGLELGEQPRVALTSASNS